MKKTYKISLAVVALCGLTACSTLLSGGSSFPSSEEAVASSWHNLKPEWKARLVQDDTQKMCTEARDRPSKEKSAVIEALNKSMPIQLPASGKMVGDWTKGEAIAQSGFGQRVGDTTAKPNGGNCYACHQITKKELSYGTIGPSLLGYAKLRGQSPEIVKYTYEKIYNAQIYSACSNMPRFGHNKVLTPEQIADVVGLLMDPKSPVNQ